MATETASSARWQARLVFISSNFADMQERDRLKAELRTDHAMRWHR